MTRRNLRTGNRLHIAATIAFLCILSAGLAGAQQETTSTSNAPDSVIAPVVPAAPKSGPSPAKTLEITTIEGQILFPKVLFISSEDPVRYPETFHRSYLGTALGLGRSAPIPKHIQVDTISSEEPVPNAPVAPTPDAPEPATPSPHDPEVNP